MDAEQTRCAPVITVSFLRDNDACEDQVKLFKKLWPQGVPVTANNVLRALEAGLDVDWLLTVLLDFDELVLFDEAVSDCWNDRPISAMLYISDKGRVFHNGRMAQLVVATILKKADRLCLQKKSQ